MSLQASTDERRLVSAMGVSLLGTATTTVLVPLIAVSEFNAGPAVLGVITASAALPALVLRLPAGAMADRAKHKIPTLILADVARAAILGSFVALWATKHASIPLLVAVTVLVGLLRVLHSAFMPAAIPAVIQPSRVASVNGRMGSLEAATDLIGPSLASGLILFLAAPLAILFDVISYVISACLKFAVKEQPIIASDQKASIDNDPVEELIDIDKPQVLSRNLRPLLYRITALSLANGVLVALLLLFLTRELLLPNASYGLVLSIGAIGGVLGGLLSGRVIDRYGTLPTMRLACILLGIGTALMPIAIFVGGIYLPILSELVGSLGAILVMVAAMTYIQLGPRERVGRSVAVVMFSVEVGHVCGALLGGVLAQWLGLLIVLKAAGLIGLSGAIASLPILWKPGTSQVTNAPVDSI